MQRKVKACMDAPIVFSFTGQTHKSKAASTRMSAANGQPDLPLDSREVPAEIDRWNWGAFLLNWIWGIGRAVLEAGKNNGVWSLRSLKLKVDGRDGLIDIINPNRVDRGSHYRRVPA